MDQSQQDSIQQNKPTQNSVPPVKKKKFWSRGRIILAIAVASVIAIAAVITYLLISGLVYIGIKNSDQRVVIQTIVCDDDIIERFNVLFFPLSEDDEKELSSIIRDINSNSNYVKDPTCQAILWWMALNRNDRDGMKKSLDALDELHKKGLFVNDSLINTFPLMSMRRITSEE